VDKEAGRRLRLAVDMFEFGVAMQRQRLRREHPGADDSEIDDLVNAWLLDRPGAPDGDCAPSVSHRRP
jgi:Rv0078B-related antitoxin